MSKTTEEKIDRLIDEICNMSETDKGNFFDRISDAYFVTNEWFSIWAGEFLSEVMPDEDYSEDLDFCGDDLDNDLGLMIDAYGVEKVALAIREHVATRLPSTYPRKYNKNGIPLF